MDNMEIEETDMEIEKMVESVVPWFLQEEANDDDDDFLIEMLEESVGRVIPPGRGPNKPIQGISGYVEITIPRYSPEDFYTFFHMRRGAFEVSFNS